MSRRKGKHVLVLGAQVPFVKGGAEFLNEGLVGFINQHLVNVSAEHVNLPFKWYPETQLVNDILAWRFLDLSESNGTPIDLVVGTKFPSYAATHPNKVIWLVHQHRTLYDLEGTQYDYHRNDVVRSKVREIDATLIREARTVKTISSTVSERLRRYNGIESQVLFPPSKYSRAIYAGEYGDYVLFLGRLDKIKRPDLLLHGVADSKKRVSVRFAGEGPLRAELEALAAKLGIKDSCRFLGFLPDAELLSTLSGARAVFYAPFDEDYGYAAVEAFQAGKPVITCTDSGEVTALVRQTGAGWVVDPSPGEISDCLDQVAAMSPADLGNLCNAGTEMALSVTWEKVCAALIEPYL